MSKLLKSRTDPYIRFLEYWNTPVDGLTSPLQLVLSCTNQHLKPKIIPQKIFKEGWTKQQLHHKSYYNKRMESPGLNFTRNIIYPYPLKCQGKATDYWDLLDTEATPPWITSATRLWCPVEAMMPLSWGHHHSEVAAPQQMPPYHTPNTPQASLQLWSDTSVTSPQQTCYGRPLKPIRRMNLWVTQSGLHGKPLQKTNHEERRCSITCLPCVCYTYLLVSCPCFAMFIMCFALICLAYYIKELLKIPAPPPSPARPFFP